METSREKKDISIIQDSKIAMQVINKAMTADKGFNFIYLDNRRAEATDSRTDNRSITCKDRQQLTDTDIIPNIIPSRTGTIPEYLQNNLAHLMEKFPEPKLDHIIRSIFEIAFQYGTTNEQRGKWLGIGKGKMQYWIKKLNLTNGE